MYTLIALTNGSGAALKSLGIAIKPGAANSVLVTAADNTVKWQKAAGNQPVTTVADLGTVTAPVDGMLVFNSTNKKIYVYSNGSWAALATSNTFSKTTVAIPAGTSAGFLDGGNSSVQVTLTLLGISTDDGITVNFASADYASFTGLTILSAVAVAPNTVIVHIADFRNPAVPGYASPAIDGKNLVVTRIGL